MILPDLLGCLQGNQDAFSEIGTLQVVDQRVGKDTDRRTRLVVGRRIKGRFRSVAAAVVCHACHDVERLGLFCSDRAQRRRATVSSTNNDAPVEKSTRDQNAVFGWVLVMMMMIASETPKIRQSRGKGREAVTCQSDRGFPTAGTSAARPKKQCSMRDRTAESFRSRSLCAAGRRKGRWRSTRVTSPKLKTEAANCSSNRELRNKGCLCGTLDA